MISVIRWSVIETPLHFKHLTLVMPHYLFLLDDARENKKTKSSYSSHLSSDA